MERRDGIEARDELAALAVDVAVVVFAAMTIEREGRSPIAYDGMENPTTYRKQDTLLNSNPKLTRIRLISPDFRNFIVCVPS